MPVTDLAGQWQYLGTITPLFDQWVRFPTKTNTTNSVIRLTFYGDMRKIVSYGVVRPYYLLPQGYSGQGKRIYPRSGSAIIDLQIPSQMLWTSEVVDRYFEVRKFLWDRRFGYKLSDEPWLVAIETLEFISLSTNKQIILTQAEQVELAAAVIRGLLPIIDE